MPKNDHFHIIINDDFVAAFLLGMFQGMLPQETFKRDEVWEHYPHERAVGIEKCLHFGIYSDKNFVFKKIPEIYIFLKMILLFIYYIETSRDCFPPTKKLKKQMLQFSYYFIILYNT